MKRNHLAATVAMAATLLFTFAATSAQADIIIDFSGQSPGTITDLGGGNFSGTGIEIALVDLNGTPSNIGTYDCLGCTLSFNTSTGTISIFGTVDTDGTSGVADAGDVGGASGATLLSGTIASFSFSPLGGGFLFTASGPDTKNPDLLTFAGLPTNTPFAFFGISLSTQAAGTSGTYNVTSSDISNKVVPEPASLLLLGSGLAGLGFVGRRRKGSKV